MFYQCLSYLITIFRLWINDIIAFIDLYTSNIHKCICIARCFEQNRNGILANDALFQKQKPFLFSEFFLLVEEVTLKLLIFQGPHYSELLSYQISWLLLWLLSCALDLQATLYLAIPSNEYVDISIIQFHLEL